VSVLVDRCGLKLSSTMAIRTSIGCSERRWRQNAKNAVRCFLVTMWP
jgi:hypothetical protein